MSFKIKSRRFIARNLNSFVEFVYHIKIKNTSFKNAPVIILTPGKVGSSSVYHTLKKKIKNPVYHIHQISKSGIENETKKFLNSPRKSRPLHLIVSKLLRKRIDKYNGDLFIITIVREPIPRFISSFFQNTELYKNELENKKLEINTSKAQELLYKNFDSDICGVVEEWFKLEIENNFGIDVFDTPFDTSKNYSIRHNGKAHLLLLRTEDLNTIFPQAIKEFLDLENPIGLENINVGQEKHYANSYKDVKNSIKLPPRIIESIINSKYFKHFYSGKEQEVHKKWARKTD